MPGNLKGLIITLVIIGASFATSSFFKDSLIKRKVLHIGVSLFVFPYCYLFTSDYIPVLGLACFALYFCFFCKEQKGLMVYPFSAILMIGVKNLGFGNNIAFMNALLGMGMGDGFAAIVGKKYGKKTVPFSKNKTFTGSFVLFFIVSAVCLMSCTVFGSFDLSFKLTTMCIATGLIAAFTEAVSPGALDNLTLPLIIYLMVSLYDRII